MIKKYTTSKTTSRELQLLKEMLNQNTPILASEFLGKLHPCLATLDELEDSMDIVHQLYQKHYQSWNEEDQIKVIRNLFAYLYGRKNYYILREIPASSVSFCAGLDFNEGQLENLYDVLFELAKNAQYSDSFIVNAFVSNEFRSIAEEKFMASISNPNSAYDDYDYIYRNYFNRIAPYCSKECFIAAAESLKIHPWSGNSIIDCFIVCKQKEALEIAMQIDNLSLTSYLLEKVMSYAEKEKMDMVYKRALRYSLSARVVDFETVVDYYDKLSEEERKKDFEYLCTVSKENHFEKAFKVLALPASEITNLRGLTLEQFIYISEEIKEKFPEKYPKGILSAVDKVLSRADRYTDFDEVFDCIEEYSESASILLADENVKQISLLTQGYRTRYLNLLKRYDLLSLLNATLYRG